ncbi:MAG: Pantothenate synthetase [Chloroflexota bacterium]
MQVVRTGEELAAAVAALPRPLALVPTMGALHEGHAALIRSARAEAASVVVSVYVNPRQFGSTSDLAAYPRDLDADVRLAAAAGADLLFAPDDAAVYPPGVPVAESDPGPLAARLEGADRPGHFLGVATVVNRLFDLVAPDVAHFGEKDAQQVRVVEWLAARRNPPVRIRRVATVRDVDGLALSSRNARLSPSARAQALAIPRALAAVRDAYEHGERRVAVLRAAAARELAAARGLTLHYLDLADGATLAPLDDRALLSDAASGSVLVSLAATVDGVRLIDALALRA